MTDSNTALAAPAPSRNALTRLSSDGGGIVFTSVAEARDVAYLMAGSDKAVRKHLRNNPGACFGIVIQAVEWGMSPYAVANKSYEVNDQLAYESQLIQAVILRRAPIKGRIKYAFEGEGNDRVCIASAVTLEGETVEYRSPAFGKITPKNSPLWKNDPDQQQCYYSGRALCRRHFPDVLLGIYDVDELDANSMRDVTPPQGSGLAARLGAAKPEGGFDAKGVADTIQTASVDWSDRDAAVAAIQAGVFPSGYSRDAEGALVVPEEKIPEHGVIVSLFREVRAADGTVLKSASKPAETRAEAVDPDALRDAGSAALSGAERTPPEGMTEALNAAWLAEYDRVLADAEANG